MTRLSHLKLKIHRQRTGSNKWVCVFPPKEKRVQEKHYHWNATIGCAFVHLYKWFVLSNKAVILTDLQECFLALMNSANEVFLLWCCTVEQMLAVASFVPDAFRELQKWSETQVWQTHSCASTSEGERLHCRTDTNKHAALVSSGTGEEAVFTVSINRSTLFKTPAATNLGV